MSDYTVMVDRQARVFLGGPPLVKMATGEDADEEELGGAEMHARVAGWPTTSPPTSSTRIRLGRQIVATCNWRKLGPGRRRPADEPLHDADELLGIVSADLRRAVRRAGDPRPRRSTARGSRSTSRSTARRW